MSMVCMTKRNITAEDLKAAAQLSRLWDEYQSQHPGVIENDIAAALGMSQPMFSHLKRGTTTWSTDHVLMMAHFFKVDHSVFKEIPYLDFIPKPKDGSEKGLYITDPQVIHAAKVMIDLPEFGKSEGVQRIDALAQLLAHYGPKKTEAGK